MKIIKGKNIILIIFSIFSIFFLISGIISSQNYANVLIYRNKVINENPQNVRANFYEKNNTILLSFSFKNPSPYSINFYSFTALFYVNNTTVSTFQRTYYYFEEFPIEIKKFSELNLTFFSPVYQDYIPLVKNSTVFKISIQMEVRFSGFSYYYENPGENYSPESYYLTEMIMMEIDWSGEA
ncbi:MAG: hypothetical protein QXU37_03335 [Thermoplasmata archaeon]